MATIGNYPDGVGTAGPYISRLIDVPIDYAVTRYEFEDGGVEVNVQPCGIRRWQLDYEGLSTSDLSTLTTHFNNAKGRVNDFSFYHRRAATTYSGVKYVSLDIAPRAKNWSNNAAVTLEVQMGDSVCGNAWTLPTPTALPQPPTAGAPRAVRFQEMVAEWGNYGQTFGDNVSSHNTIQTARVRRFEIEWDGLSEAEAATLDAHWQSTSGGLAFSITNPHTAETISGCRYLSYTQSPLTRKWSQRRSAVVIKFTN